MKGQGQRLVVNYAMQYPVEYAISISKICNIPLTVQFQVKRSFKSSVASGSSDENACSNWVLKVS